MHNIFNMCQNYVPNVFFQSTAVLSYRASSNKQPLSCSLQSLEVFSCCLASEDDTALSIIDPMMVSIDLNVPPVKKRSPYVVVADEKPVGLLDAMVETDMLPIIEV